MQQIDPYLTFNGNCEKAFNFYKSVFGGEFTCLKRLAEAPQIEGLSFTEEELQKIMSIALPINEACTLTGGDAHPAMGEVIFGRNISLSVSVASKERADQVFNSLSAGGLVYMPMNNMFPGAYFGMCEDRFGMSWMINFKAR